MNAKDKESPWNEIFDNFSFLVFSLSLSPSLWISSHLVDWSRINIGGLFCHRRKNIGYCPRKVVDPHPDLLIDWSEERISCHCLSQLSSSSLNISIHTKGETKSTWPKIFGLSRWTSILIGWSWSKKPENKKSLSQLPPPPWEGTPLAWLTNELTTSLFVKSIEKWEITILLDFDHPHSGNTGVKLGRKSPDPDIFFKLQNGSNAILKLI